MKGKGKGDFIRGLKGGRFERTKPHLQAFHGWWQIMAITGDGIEGYSLDCCNHLLVVCWSGRFLDISELCNQMLRKLVVKFWSLEGPWDLDTNYVGSNYFLVSGIQPIKYLINVKNKNKVRIHIQKFDFNTTELINCDLSNLTVHKHGRIFCSGYLLHSSSLKKQRASK